MKYVIAMALVLGVAGCADRRTSSTPLAAEPATQPVAAARGPNLLERTADSTWATIKKPVEWMMPGKKAAASEPATGPAPQAAEGTIVVRGREGSVSAMRIPAPVEETPATRPGDGK